MFEYGKEGFFVCFCMYFCADFMLINGSSCFLCVFLLIVVYFKFLFYIENIEAVPVMRDGFYIGVIYLALSSIFQGP